MKNINHFHVILVLILGLVSVSTNKAQAALVDRGGGLIYDDVLNVTWLQDANYAKTSGYDSDGRMLWNAAKIWADDLIYVDTVRNTTWTDWRLPTVGPANGSNFNYAWSPFGDTDIGTNITSPAAEMSYMYYVNLGNRGRWTPSGEGPVCYPCLENVGPFLNLMGNDIYWYGTPYPPYLDGAFNFYMDYGNQGASGNTAEHIFYAWAVRPGDVAAVPVPAAFWLFGSGLIGMLGFMRRCKS